MALPTGFLDELRGRTSLARVVGRKVVWDPRKSNAAKGDLWAPCPFHQEKTASFHVDDRKGFYYCFGCQAKGDAIRFVTETENVGFMEAVEILAREAGMTVPAPDPRARAEAEARTGLTEIVEEAVRFFRLQLASARAGEARAYLDRRGLSEAARARFEIGWSPDGPATLIEAFRARGIPLERLAEAGLAKLPEEGRPARDRFRGRIMFPIRDARGRATGFGARAIRAGQEPKYLNSPETALFDKGRSLYNHAPAREAAGKAGTLIVAEGYMDVIALVEAGFAHTVAPLGTAVTADQLALLWRMADEPVIALDGDKAGLAAALRLVDLALPLLAPGKSLRFATLPPPMDPDELIRSGGPAAMQAVLDRARPLIDLLWQRETEARPTDTPERRAAFDRALRDAAGRIADEAVRAHYLADLRRRRRALFRPAEDERAPDPGRDSPRPLEGRRPRGPGYRPGKARPVSSAAARASALARPDTGPEIAARGRECAILLLALAHPALAAERDEALDRLPFLNRDLSDLRDALLSALPGALATPDPRAALDASLGEAMARAEPGPGLRRNPNLRPDAPPAAVAAELDEVMARHRALAGFPDELAEAVAEMGERPDDASLARLIEATRSLDAARRGHVADSATPDEDSAAEDLQSYRTKQIWVRKSR